VRPSPKNVLIGFPFKPYHHIGIGTGPPQCIPTRIQLQLAIYSPKVIRARGNYGPLPGSQRRVIRWFDRGILVFNFLRADGATIDLQIVDDAIEGIQSRKAHTLPDKSSRRKIREISAYLHSRVIGRGHSAPHRKAPRRFPIYIQPDSRLLVIYSDDMNPFHKWKSDAGSALLPLTPHFQLQT